MNNIFSSASENHIKKSFKFFGNEGQFFTYFINFSIPGKIKGSSSINGDIFSPFNTKFKKDLGKKDLFRISCTKEYIYFSAHLWTMNLNKRYLKQVF